MSITAEPFQETTGAVLREANEAMALRQRRLEEISSKSVELRAAIEATIYDPKAIHALLTEISRRESWEDIQRLMHGGQV